MGHSFLDLSTGGVKQVLTVTLFHYNHASALHFLLISPIRRSGGMPNVVINGEENVVENGVDGKGEGRLSHFICLVFIGGSAKNLI